MHKAGDSLWTKDAHGSEHPVQSLLLAFIRGECPEHEKAIQEHLTMCDQCSQAFAGLSQTSKTLSQLKYMSRYLSYPELKPELVFARAKDGVPLRSAWTGQRKGERHEAEAKRGYARKSGFRLISVPAAFGIGLLFMTVIIVMAYTFVNLMKLPVGISSSPNTVHLNTFSNPSSVAGQPTPPTRVPIVVPSPTSSVTVTVDPTVTSTIAAEPTIKFCVPSAKMRLEICGYNFKPGDTILLVIDLYGNKPAITRPALTVDTTGKFEDSWSIDSCRDLPLAVRAEDKSQPLAPSASIALTHISMPGCGETPTSAPGSPKAAAR